MEHYIKSAALYRSQHLHHALVHAYLGENTDFRNRLADEIDNLEWRLRELQREGVNLDLIHTYREMLYGRVKLYTELS